MMFQGIDGDHRPVGIRRNATVDEVLSNNRRRSSRHHSGILQEVERHISLCRQKQRNNVEDTHHWKRSSVFKCKFSTQETWKLLREEKPKCEWVPGVYFPQATPKCAFISWLATLNKLSTMDQIQNWNRGVNTDCVFSVSKIWKLETTCSLSASTLFRSGKHSENEYYNANSRTTGQQLFKSSQTKV